MIGRFATISFLQFGEIGERRYPHDGCHAAVDEGKHKNDRGVRVLKLEFQRERSEM